MLDTLQTCFLNIVNKEMMFASFNSKTIPSCRDMLNTCASDILICFTVSFCVLCAIPYTHGDVFFTLLMLLAITSGVTSNCHNLSPSVPLKFVSVTGNELVSSLVNTKLKCIFNSSANNTCVIIYPALCNSGSTLSRALSPYLIS